jgi:hypothetical protein
VASDISSIIFDPNVLPMHVASYSYMRTASCETSWLMTGEFRRFGMVATSFCVMLLHTSTCK